MHFRRLEDAELSGKTAVIRVDFNVPRGKDGSISDDTRIQAALPTIRAIRAAGGKVVLLSHFGRPKGEVKAELSLDFLLPVLGKELGETIGFSNGTDPAALTENITLIENSRFHAGETKGDEALGAQWAALGDIFIQDAFSAAHRDHVSSAGLAKFLPAYAGLSMERELDHLAQALENPKQPVLGVVGGAKVSTKIDLLSNLVSKLDMLAIGGGMANTFLAAQGYNVGKSLCEHDLAGTAREIMDAAQTAGCRILLPIDVVAATEFAANAPHRVCGLEEVAPHEMILDAGPETVNGLLDAIDQASTLIWNGPLGAFELTPFDTSTVEAAAYAGKRVKENGLVAVAGGGDTVAALKHAGAADDFTFISTAGGAFLEWMEGKALPGVEILKV